jgi:hypothetical protein
MPPTIPIPPATVPARTQYVADCLDALRAGLIPQDEQSLIYTRIVGWTDLCSDADRAVYLRLAGQFKLARRAAA